MPTTSPYARSHAASAGVSYCGPGNGDIAAGARLQVRAQGSARPGRLGERHDAKHRRFVVGRTLQVDHLPGEHGLALLE